MTRFVAFDEVHNLGPHEGLVGFSVDLPAAGSEEPYHSIPLLGWALGREEPVTQIEIRDGREALYSVPATLPRPDIEAAFGSVPGAGACGFEGEIGSVTQRSRFELTLVALTASGARMRLATVRGRRRAHAPRGRDGIQPLMLTTIGRSGSTWLSGLLGHHPAILAHLPWAYDWRFTSYWFEAMRWLTHPSAYLQQVLPDISSARWWLGDRGVSYHPRDRDDPSFEDWLGSAEVEHTIDMCIARAA